MTRGVGVDEVVNVGILDVKVCVLIRAPSDEDEAKDDGAHERHVHIVPSTRAHLAHGLPRARTSAAARAADARSRRTDSQRRRTHIDPCRFC